MKGYDQYKQQRSSQYLYTEAIEVSRLSPLSFYEAGEKIYPQEQFYWQNAEQTVTYVGVGHAKVLLSTDPIHRFDEIDRQWQALCNTLIKEDRIPNPILFGGFAFDPVNEQPSEWDQFPPAYFVIPRFQLMVRDGKTSCLINLVTTKETIEKDLQLARQEAEHVIHETQVSEFGPFDKPVVTDIVEREKKQYLAAVAEVTQAIQSGAASKVVLARSIQMKFDQSVKGVHALHHIANEQRESYHFGLQIGEQLFFGATPERLLEIKDGQAYSASVAGSIRRGKTAEEDRLLGEALLTDEKNLGEHAYVVQMIKQVFTTYCSSSEMPKEPRLLKVRDIQHLYTPISGPVKNETIFSFIQALHPTPALGGVPTEKAVTIIREQESMNRGYYAAPIGWVDTAGNGEFAVAIRSALLQDQHAYLYAGGGIVADSTPQDEYDETWVKFRPVIRALGGKINVD